MEEIISPNIYYKGTRRGGVSYHDSSFVYHLGLNEHEKPDKSGIVCSQGIHLAKDLQSLKKLCPNAEEIYECHAGVILADDFEKVRVAYCFLVRRLSGLLDFPLPQNPLCGTEWLEKHCMDITWDDYNKQGITIKTDRQEVTLKASMKPKDIKTIMAAVR